MPKEFKPAVTDGFTQLRNVLPDGKVVSTIKLGADTKDLDNLLIRLALVSGDERPFAQAPYNDFETMVFPSEDDFSEIDCKRYSTAEEATQGHEEMVRLWTNKN